MKKKLETCEKKVVALADEADLLGLNENLLKNCLFTVENNEVGFGKKYLFENVSISVLVMHQLFHHKSELIHGSDSRGLLEYLLNRHHGVVVLIQDCDGLPLISL